MEYQHIRYEMRGTAAWITLDRPSVYNALDIETASELSAAIEAAADDRSVRVAVVTGSGKAFCAGGDVRAFHAHLNEAPDYVRTLVTSVHGALRRLYEMPVPVVAAINGAAAGAGLGLAIAPNLRSPDTAPPSRWPTPPSERHPTPARLTDCRNL
jgi:2-(1,2-epoxy-1,2-dihydrophenyl)acetyl-CoA isomerase